MEPSETNNASKLTQSLKQEALDLGFDFSGVVAAVEPAGFSRLNEWISNGFHGEMDYMETCLLYTSPSPRDLSTSRMPSSA